MRFATPIDFAAVAKALGDSARRTGLAVPAFRSPPSVPGAPRTIRRRSDGSATVAVALRGRSVSDVALDMVDGVVAVNRLDSDRADEARAALLAAVGVQPAPERQLVGTEGVEPSLGAF